MTSLRNSSTEQIVQQFQAAEQENERLKTTTVQLIADKT